MALQLKSSGQEELGMTQRTNWLSKLTPEERSAHMKKIRKNRKIHNQWAQKLPKEEVAARMEKVRGARRGGKRQPEGL